MSYSMFNTKKIIMRTVRKKFELRAIFLCMAFFLSLTVFGQNSVTINGVVTTSTDKEPVIGATVKVIGTSDGTITDLDGKYSLSVRVGSEIEVSYIGYLSQKFKVSSTQTVYNTVLSEDVTNLEEVVVVGYGTVKKKDLTGAVSSIRAKDLGTLPVTNVENMLQGRIAGVDITNNNGLPGSGTSIKVRGVGTLYDSSPLCIVDGMPGDINSVSQYDIESIEVLKDASSTAIYGARAANGVIMITTKRGKKGKTKVNFNMYVGASAISKKLDVLNADQYIDLVLELNPYFFDTAKRFMPVEKGGLGYSEEWARTTRGDMQDAVYNLGLQQEYNLGLSGGSDHGTYNVSVTYTDMDAFTVGYNYKHLKLLSNNEFIIHKNIKVGSNLTVRRKDTKGGQFYPSGAAVYQFIPYLPIEDENDPTGYSTMTNELDGVGVRNPMINFVTSQNNQTSKLASIREVAYLDISLFDMFKWRSQASFSYSSTANMGWTQANMNAGVEVNASISESMSYSQSMSLENYLTFNKEFGVHSINAMIGNTYSSSKYNYGRSLSAEGGSSADELWENQDILLITAAPSSRVTGNSASHSAYLSYFGRINYSLMDKYLFTFNYRQDASPNFSPKNRWGRFPSGAFAWRIDQEEFMQGLDNLSQLKFRLSAGLSGNDRIDEYAYLASLYSNPSIGTAFGSTPSFVGGGVTVNTLPSANIKWETCTSYNVGLDFGLWNNTFSGSLDIYKRDTKDILIQVPVPGSSGVSIPSYQNAASVRNTGLDLNLTYQNNINGFNYSITGVASYNKNEVTSLGGGEPIMKDYNRTEEGHAIGSFYGYVAEKVISTQAEADAYNKMYYLENPVQPGDIAWKNMDDKKHEDGRYIIDDDDRTFIGCPIPEWSFGLNMSGSYKNFDMQMSFSGVAGCEIFDAIERDLTGTSALSGNRMSKVLDRWQKEGDVTDVPRAVLGDPNGNQRVSTRYIKDGDYLKMKNFTLGYTLNFKNNYIERIRFYGTVQNLFTITKFDGFDPEMSGNDNLTRGVNNNYIPVPRTFIFGIQASF